MATLTRIYDFTAGTTAVADEVDAELNQILLDYNGGIDAVNLADNAVTNIKILNSAVDGNKLANTTVKEVHMNFQFTDGPKVWKFGPNYPASGAELRICPVTYTVTSPAAAGTLSTVDVPITFNTGSFCTYGNLTWATGTLPELMGEPYANDASAADDDIPDVCWLIATSTTGATIRHKWIVDAGTATAVVMRATFWGLV